MPREAKLFDSSSGSVVRGFLKFSANIPPRWIKNAKASRKRMSGICKMAKRMRFEKRFDP